MMVYYHLFNRIENVDLCSDIVIWGNQSLLLWLSKACNPVAFFVILSGYGMYHVSLNEDSHRFSRIIKLYIHLWLCFAIFLPIAHHLNPTTYPGSITRLLENLCGYDANYNQEYWFLLPYVLLSLTASNLFKLTSKINKYHLLSILILIFLATSFIISRYKNEFLIQHLWMIHIIRYLNFLFAFILGGMTARYQWDYRFLKIDTSQWVILTTLLLLIISRCMINTNILNVPFAFLFILLVLKLPRPKWINQVLSSFGKYSMDIWFIHTWLCYYLFHDFFYSLRNPIIIYIAVFGISLLLAFIINKLYRSIIKI